MILPNTPVEIFNDSIRVGAKCSIPSVQDYYGLKYKVSECGIIESIENGFANLYMYFTIRRVRVSISDIKILKSI